MTNSIPLIEMRDIKRQFGSVIALNGVSLKVHAGEVVCLLGDNGAGKSTLIKTLSGVHAPSAGEILVDGVPRRFGSPREAQALGIATVYQDLAMIPLMSVTRNFFLGREPVKKGSGWLRIFKLDEADRIAREELKRIGIDIRNPHQAVGTLSGGERQTVAIARAVYFGAKVLILDEPTSALGVRQTATVLRYVDQVRKRGIGVILITHNVRHALAVGDTFTVLNRGKTMGTFSRADVNAETLQNLMAGGKELDIFSDELEGTI